MPRDLSPSNYAGNKGPATLTISIALSGNAEFGSGTDGPPQYVTQYAVRQENILDFSSSAAAQSVPLNSNTSWVLVIPPSGATVSWIVSSTTTTTNALSLMPNGLYLVTPNRSSQTLYITPSGTQAGLWRVLQF